MAIEDIIKQPLGLIKLSQLVLLAISIGCVFGPAHGWWYYVGATLIAAFLNAIIMLICYYWKQSFESSFLELSYTTYFVVALFISAILLFVQPHYAEAPWQHSGTSALQVIDLDLKEDPITESTTKTATTTPITTIITPTPTDITDAPTTLLTTTEQVTTTTTTPTESTTEDLSTTEQVTTTMPSESTFLSTTKDLSTTSPLTTTTETESPIITTAKPPDPFSKDGAWIAGGVFCLILSLAYIAELYFLTRRLVYSSG